MIRSATAADVGAVLELWKRARSVAASTPDTLETVTRLLDADPEALLVAEVDGALVGTLVAAWDGWRGNMYRLAVAPEARRQGIARSLVTAGEERLHARGARRIGAVVGADEVPAVALWQAMGYEADATLLRFARNL